MADDDIPPATPDYLPALRAEEIPEPSTPELSEEDSLLVRGAQRRDALHRSMLTHGNAFEGNRELSELYQDLFANLIVESTAVPGFALAQEMLLERVAFLWASQKKLDNLADPVPAQQYEKLAGRFLQALNTLFKSRSDRDADEAFKRNFITSVVRAMTAAIDDEIPDNVDLNVAIKRRLIDVLREASDQARSS